MAMPAIALPGLSGPLEPLDEVVEPIEEAVAPIEEAADTLVGTTSTASNDADEADGDDGLLPTGDGEPLEPLAPVTDPVEDALAPVTDPVEDLLDPAEPVVDVVDTIVDVVDDSAGAPSAPGSDTGGGTLPTPPATGSAPAGGNTITETAVLDSDFKTPELDTYWAGPGVSRNGSSTGRTVTTDAAPDVASPEVAEPLTAPAAEQPVAADPIGGATSSGWEAALKVFAAFLVAVTATMWQRSYAKAQIRR
jgi:hypothetical protein